MVNARAMKPHQLILAPSLLAGDHANLAASAARVAGAFEAQIVARIPAAPHDVTVAIVVTEQRTLVVK